MRLDLSQTLPTEHADYIPKGSGSMGIEDFQ